jgi:hypothetical protein
MGLNNCKTYENPKIRNVYYKELRFHYLGHKTEEVTVGVK